MPTSLFPQNARVPRHLSHNEIHQALEELDKKIRTLRNRAHATTAGAAHTYHEHIATLEVKRGKLAERLGPAPAPDAQPTSQDQNTWGEIWHGIENLRNDLRNIL
ncbi:MAG: hypothetical protein H7Z21_16390 [Hymenobacter sp.]|nr:hypothetical protein [Hymenobacter sp.]